MVSLRGGVGAFACAVVVCVLAAPAATAGAQPVQADHGARVKHVLLISVDGLHQSDLRWWVAHHPRSALARLARAGTEYRNAVTPVPSDSFPGMVAQVTGGDPRTTGIYYDDSYSHALLPAGTTNCAGATPGVEVTYFEAADLNPLSLDAGQGLANLPGSILQLTGNATTLLRSVQAARRPGHLQAGVPALLPEGEHRL